MDINQLHAKRFSIVVDCLIKGITIPFKQEWNIFYKEGQLYQTHYNQELNSQVTHKSEISLNSFLNTYNNIDDIVLKDIYGSLRLYDLHKKLTSGEKEQG